MSLTPAAPRTLIDRPVPVVDDAPGRDIGAGILIAAGFFGAFMGWAAFTPLDAAAVAPGELTVEGHRQAVQHKEGGVVKAVRVHEGQKVQAGDVLIELSGGDAAAEAKALSAEAIGLEAQRARLKAEAEGRPDFAPPSEFASLTGDDRAAAQDAMRVQRNQLVSELRADAGQKSVLRQRTAELGQQVEGYKRQIESADKQASLIEDELSGVKSLNAKGYAPLTRVRALERAQAELGGQRGQYAASVAQLQDQAGEAELQILQVSRQRGQDLAAQARDVEYRLADVLPKLAAAQDQVARTEIRAPATGSVVGLQVFNAGAVIAPGEHVMDIVPDHASLVVDARVTPADAEALHKGQTAEVRFTGIDQRKLPILKGSVTKVSADAFTDQRTGQRYFQAEITVPPSALSAVGKASGAFQLRPGLPAQVMIPLRHRTALQYIFEPLQEALWRTGRER